MPRKPRLDLREALQYVTARAAGGLDLFPGAEDREEFVARLGQVVVAAGAKLYTWCLLPDHFHLLLRTGDRPLAWMTRRLLTGHAVAYNRRHGHSGPVFRSRYRSVVVEEEPYFLELVRYVALNPVRTNIVWTMDELDAHAWCGHAALTGTRPNTWQHVDGVLRRFASDPAEAVARYRNFVAAGWNQGRRTELSGRDEPSGSPGTSAGRRVPSSDRRILGCREFVRVVWRAAGEQGPARASGRSWKEILKEVAAESRVVESRILGRSRERAVSRARREFLLRCLEQASLSITELGRVCGMNPASVSRAVEVARNERHLRGPAHRIAEAEKTEDRLGRS